MLSPLLHTLIQPVRLATLLVMLACVPMGCTTVPKENAQALYESAKEKADKGVNRSARRRFQKIYANFPTSPFAPLAMMKEAELLASAGYHAKAFDRYDQLFNLYPGEFDFNQAMTAMTEQATAIEEARHGTLFIFKGYTIPERAAPYYERILEKAPQAENSAMFQYRIGWLHQQAGDIEEAIQAYDQTMASYPDTPEEELAAYGKVVCLDAIARRNPNNTESHRLAWSEATLYLQNHPQGKRVDEVMEIQARLRKVLVNHLYEQAVYYDTIAKRPKSALIAYEQLIEQFPVSEWTDVAKQRIEALKVLSD